MKHLQKPLLFLALSLASWNYASAQIICIFCYSQNDSISNNVNNLLLNGGFESGCSNGQYYCPSSSFHNCDITNWTCTGGGSSTYAAVYNNSFTIVPQGVNAVYFGNWYCSACNATEGDTSCLTTIDCTSSTPPPGYPTNANPGYGGSTGVSLSQTVSGLVPGDTYILEFWAGGEDGGGAFFNKGLFAVDVGFGDTMLRDDDSSPINGVGTEFVVEFVAASATQTIKFTSWGHICSNCSELILDNARLYKLAEASSIIPPCQHVATNPESTIFYPNVFTPGSDGKNDMFTIPTTGFSALHCEIYDRWGVKMYTWDGTTGGWDGKVKGKDATDGVYYYIATGEQLDGTATKHSGFFELIREK